MKSREYLTEIRRATGLKRAVLRKIEVNGGKATFYLATDLNYKNEDEEYARSVTERYTPAGLKGDIKIVKSVPDAEGVRACVLDLLKTKYPAVAAFISPNDVAVELETGGGKFFIGVGEVERDFSADGVLDGLSEELGRKLCGVWHGEFRFLQKEREELVPEEAPPAEFVAGPRFFAICEYADIDGGKPKQAIYIADLTKEMQGVSVCGNISYIEERKTKTDKPYFSLTISDGTGQLRLSYFTKKATLEKVRGLKQGDSVCITGDNELFNGSLSFRAKAIDYGSQPEGFVPEERPSKPVPLRYKRVFPVPTGDLVQGGLFESAEALPKSVCAQEFVVFDLETTGLNNTPATGSMDRIIEVGAVKIKNGQIFERFSSFVACPVKLSGEIVKLTGISDDMLAGAPDIADVIADFYKFAAGCVLVGHNVQFDYKFIRYYGEQEGYLFDQKQYDTLSFAQEMLRLSNYKLNTVADYFGFGFNHHRAYEDAFVTAKIFLALARMKKGLPR
ncbi:MAG: hypothetical protein K2N84_03610 [Clostridia bacterium]|nr:hypothetical protein [Clostridia bacterium]